MRLILIFLTALSFPAFSQVYKWTDENGVTHFGNQPPPGEQEEVHIRESKTGPMITDRQRLMMEQRDARRTYRSEQSSYDSDVDYVCTGARNRVKNWEERWDIAKRQGYSVSEKQYFDQRIREAERHRDNVCR
ncbi:DUF4124 domain-containing protein [Marinobacter sp.]|uniref:DUF4124 domain-containing protein n=1 Tax=Marinobacter sp. TaxID=50741 RepID=UPI0035C66DD8